MRANGLLSPTLSSRKGGRLMFGRLVAIDMALLTELAERADGGSIKMHTRIAHGDREKLA
jgi:hypothetical protein